MAGPRGRRLCFELLRTGEPDAVSIGLFHLAREHSGATLSWGFFRPGAADPPPPEPAELARLVLARDPRGIADAAVTAALVRAVDAARYWQEPDGEDAVAALPELRDALTAVARRVADLPATGWWSAGLRPQQWAIDRGDAAVPDPRDARAALEAWRAAVAKGEAWAERESPRDVSAPWSNTWWSTPSGVLATTGEMRDGTPAGVRLVEDSLGWREVRAIPVRGAGRVLEIRGIDDWAELCRRHPLEVTASRRHDWYQATGCDGRWVIPDWSLVAREWDAVHLPVEGYLACAGRAIRVDDEHSSVIAGWSPDTTYWLTDAARVTGDPVTWRQERRDSTWRRAGA